MPATRKPSRLPKLGLYALFAIGGLLASCSVEETLPPPGCEQFGSALIVAQSVPTATYVPCLDPLPEGWTVATVKVTQAGSVVVFDSDRAGNHAAELRFEADCDLSGTVSAPSDLPSARRFERIESLRPVFRAQRFYTVDGACVTWRFELGNDVSAAESVAVADALRLISRQAINDDLRRTFIDEEL